MNGSAYGTYICSSLAILGPLAHQCFLTLSLVEEFVYGHNIKGIPGPRGVRAARTWALTPAATYLSNSRGRNRPLTLSALPYLSTCVNIFQPTIRMMLLATVVYRKYICCHRSCYRMVFGTYYYSILCKCKRVPWVCPQPTGHYNVDQHNDDQSMHHQDYDLS